MGRPLIFVYGTLRRGCNTGAHQRFLGDAEFLGSARVRGRLYQISYYPGLVPDVNAGWVSGEVYRLADEAQLGALDDYEECPPPRHPNQEYRREQLQLIMAKGAQLQAWTYVYQQSTRDLQIIASGDFLSP